MNRTRAAWMVWGLGVAAYAVAVFQRASLGVAGPLAQHRFHTGAAVLSLFVVIQLAVYAGLQVPVGVMLDRFGSRRMIATGAAVMGLGQLALAESHSVGLAVTGRILVGAGDAMTFVSVLRLVPAWFPARRVPLVTQLTALLGQAGQVAAAIPLVALLHSVGWTWAFAGAAVAGVVVAVAVALGLRNAPRGTPPGPAPRGAAEVRLHLRDAWREPGTRLGLWTHFATQFSGTVFALLWGYPFLTQAEGLSPAEAGALLTVLVVVAAAIGPVLGHLVGRWPLRRSIPTLAVIGASALMWTIVLVWPGHAPFAVLLLLVLVLATNGPGSMVGFDYARTENPPVRLGSATGIVNVGGFAASLSTILLVGVLLSASGDFRVALSVQYVMWAVGVAGVLTSRRRLRAARGIELDPFPSAVVRVARERRRERAGAASPAAAPARESAAATASARENPRANASGDA